MSLDFGAMEVNGSFASQFHGSRTRSPQTAPPVKPNDNTSHNDALRAGLLHGEGDTPEFHKRSVTVARPCRTDRCWGKLHRVEMPRCSLGLVSRKH